MSDSESNAGDSIISTSVLLGYAEEEPTEDPISQLGGPPKWLHPDSPADSRLAKCQNCNELMSMLLQLNGDIPETPHERVFYVWACRRKTCWRKKGTVRAFRGVKCASRPKEEAPAVKEEPKEEVKEKEPVNTGGFLFGGAGTGKSTAGANPFSTGASNPFSSNNPFTSNNPFATPATPPAPKSKPETKTEKMTKSFAETLKIGISPTPTQEDPLFYGPAEPWPDPLPHVYPPFHLDAEHEQLETRKPELPRNVQIVDNDEYNDLPMANTDAGESNTDKTFQKFADRVSQNPEQVLRYERLGTPLLYSKDDEIGKLLLDNNGDFTTRKILPCGNCRKPESRAFEFQLMPYAISVLERDEMGLDGMEWGTIIVATCVCVPKVLDANGAGYVEEWVGVQWESLRLK